MLTKRSLLLSAPSEEDEIKWLSAVRALMARRTSPPGSSTNPQGGSIAAGTAIGGGSLEGVGSGIKTSPSTSNRKRSASGASALATRDEHQHN